MDKPTTYEAPESDLDAVIFLPILRTPAERRADLHALADQLTRADRKATRAYAAVVLPC